ncbi:MAG: ABC transporter permease [Calditrichaeota bacterium]|nr:ABC transporter permease [Calditrichota bacterium]
MRLFRLAFKNAFRHRFRALLTILAMAVALMAFGVLRTVVTAWNVGIDAAQADRLVTRQAVSFIFPLPLAYFDKVREIEGIESVTHSSWFGGIYIDRQNFFARFAIDAETFFEVYPEYMLTPEETENFKKQRNACVVGADIAKQYGFKIGDKITLEGDIYPGTWDFIVAGIYQPKFKSTDATAMVFHWHYLNERVAEDWPTRANLTGWLTAKIADGNRAAEISAQIDDLFRNSAAETKTETENEFARGFIASFGAIFGAMNFVSFTIVAIILLVVANTMLMAARERTREYAVLKTLGFSVGQISALILMESTILSIVGGTLGLGLIAPLIAGLAEAVPKAWFPIFQLEPITVFLLALAVVFIALAAAIFPIRRVARATIVEGIRFAG